MLDNAEPEALPKECCGGCKYYVVNKMKISEGRCRRLPPHPNLIIAPSQHPGQPPQMLIKADFPPVSIDEWCGEWSARGTKS